MHLENSLNRAFGRPEYFPKAHNGPKQPYIIQSLGPKTLKYVSPESRRVWELIPLQLGTSSQLRALGHADYVGLTRPNMPRYSSKGPEWSLLVAFGLGRLPCARLCLLSPQTPLKEP